MRIFANNDNYNDSSNKFKYNLIKNKQNNASKINDQSDESYSDDECSDVSSINEYMRCDYTDQNHLLERIWRVANYEVNFNFIFFKY